MSERNLQTEIVQALEAGFNKHLNRSIVYSPFRLFFNLFKKSNPKSMQQARQIIAQDVLEVMTAIQGFNQSTFLINQNQFTPKGKELLKKCYNIGIRILKTELTLALAFKALRNTEMRQEIYQNILEELQNTIAAMVETPLAENKAAEIDPA